MERLLAHPPHLPLVHADHSHRLCPTAAGENARLGSSKGHAKLRTKHTLVILSLIHI